MLDNKNIVIQSCSLIGNFRETNEDEIFYDLNNNSNFKMLSIFDGHGGNRVSKFLLNKLGDSRIICCNKYNIGIPLTIDHKPDFFYEKNRIENLKGTITERSNDCPRIKGLATSRSFGDGNTKPYVSHLPEIFDYKIKNDKYIVLACDGIWDVLSNQDVINFINCKLSNNININNNNNKKNNIAYELAEYAYKKGSTDNISIIILFFKNNLKNFI